MGDFINFLGNNLADFWTYTGLSQRHVWPLGDVSCGLILHLLSRSQRV